MEACKPKAKGALKTEACKPKAKGAQTKPLPSYVFPNNIKGHVVKGGCYSVSPAGLCEIFGMPRIF